MEKKRRKERKMNLEICIGERMSGDVYKELNQIRNTYRNSDKKRRAS